MNGQVYAELIDLEDMKTAALKKRYREVFGASTNTNNAAYLRKRIAWRIQSQAEGSLSERARQRSVELANEADLRQRAPEQQIATTTIIRKKGYADPARDPRLPQPGAILSRNFKGREVQVTILEDGFSFEGRHYTNLSSIAGEITGSRWNGFVFFGLRKKEKA